MLVLLLQFILELARALLIDELSSRVRGRVDLWRDRKSTHRIVRSIQRRNRARLLHRLRTQYRRDR